MSFFLDFVLRLTTSCLCNVHVRHVTQANSFINKFGKVKLVYYTKLLLAAFSKVSRALYTRPTRGRPQYVQTRG